MNLDAVVNGLLLGGLYALIALGLSVVFGVLKLINLAHGGSSSAVPTRRMCALIASASQRRTRSLSWRSWSRYWPTWCR